MIANSASKEIPSNPAEPPAPVKNKTSVAPWFWLVILFYGVKLLSGAFTLIDGMLFHERVVSVAGRGGTANYGDGLTPKGIRPSDLFLTAPSGLDVDGAGNLFIADVNDNRVVVLKADGRVYPLAGTGVYAYSGDGGPATQAALSRPSAVLADREGNLYISDCCDQRIRKVSAKGVITTFAGTGEAGFTNDGIAADAAEINRPGGMSMDRQGNLYFADMKNHRVRKVDPQGTITTLAGTGEDGFSGDGQAAISAKLSYPASVVADPNGNVYICDTGNDRVRVVDRNGIIRTVAGGWEPGIPGFFHSLLRSLSHGNARYARLLRPNGLALDSKGRLFVSDSMHQRVLRIEPYGTYRTVLKRVRRIPWDFWNHMNDSWSDHDLARELKEPKGLAIDRDGNLYVADSGNNVIRMLPHAAAPGLYNGAPYPPR